MIVARLAAEPMTCYVYRYLEKRRKKRAGKTADEDTYIEFSDLRGTNYCEPYLYLL